MTPEDIRRFRDEVAAPQMRKLLDNTAVPEGYCCIDNVEISFIDGRSWGVDSQFKASGLMFVDGKVEPYEFEETDISISEFVQVHKDCVFLSGGSLKVSDELEEFELNSNISNLYGVCLKLFEGFECTRDLTYAMDPLEYLKMKEAFRGNEKQGLVEKISEAEKMAKDANESAEVISRNKGERDFND